MFGRVQRVAVGASNSRAGWKSRTIVLPSWLSMRVMVMELTMLVGGAGGDAVIE